MNLPELGNLEVPDAVRADHVDFGIVRGILFLLAVLLAQLAGNLIAGIAVGAYYEVAGIKINAADVLKPLQPEYGAWGLIAGTVLAAWVAVALSRHWAKSLLFRGEISGFGWRAATGGAVALGLVGGCALALAASALIALVPPAPEQLTGPLERLSEAGGFPAYAVATVAIVAAPPLEEFVFRGALLAAVARSWGTAAAVVLTTLAFVALHLPDKIHYWPGLIAVTGLALAAAAVRIHSRSLVPAIALHLVYNLVITLVSNATS